MLTIIVKPTENCNANCVYCSVNDKSMKKKTMSERILRALYRRIGEYLANSDDRVNITWHGGEPMLPGPAFYEKVIAIQKRFLGKNAERVQHSMQTNLTMLNDSFRDIFERLGIRQLGSSFEFVPGLRGIGKNCDSQAYERKFFDAISKLNQWGVGFGVVYVVTSRSIGRGEEVLNYLINLVNHDGGLRINPLYLEGEAKKEAVKPLGVSAVDFGNFLGCCFRSWYPRREIYNPIEPFLGFYNFLVGKSKSLCCDESGVCGSSHLGVDPDGNIYQCGRAMDSHVLKYGHLLTHDFKGVFEHELKHKLSLRSAELRRTECSDCRFFDYCHGGCPIDGFIYRADWNRKTIWCEARRIFFQDHMEPVMNIQLRSQ